MSEAEQAGVRLPGIELNYPTTWHGTIATIAVCTMVTVVLHTFLGKVDDDTFNDAAQSVINLFNPSSVQNVAKEIQEDEQVAKLTAETSKLSETESAAITDAEKEAIKDSVAAISLATTAVKERRPESYSLEEGFKIMADVPENKAIVQLALNNKSVFGNSYWYSSARLADLVKKQHPNEFTSYDLRKSIKQLADSGVLSIKSDGKGVKYGVTPDSEALSLFADKAGL